MSIKELKKKQQTFKKTNNQIPKNKMKNKEKNNQMVESYKTNNKNVDQKKKLNVLQTPSYNRRISKL